MALRVVKDLVISGAGNKPIMLDVFFPAAHASRIVIYAHGFNGFKDWGNFDLIAAQFAAAGMIFIKFNFSHNGTTPETPEDFTDLDAYAANNYSKELYDLQQVIDWTQSDYHPFVDQMHHLPIALLGHSRGGGIVLIKAAEEQKVRQVITWASVAACNTPWGKWDQARINEWKQSGRDYYFNARTQQQMPLDYQLYEDVQQHSNRLNVTGAIAKLDIPILICHGSNDLAVPVEAAHQLHSANRKSQLFVIASDHVFGRKHPWLQEKLPETMQSVIDRSIAFLDATATPPQ